MAAFIDLLIALGIIASAEEATKDVLNQNKDVLGTDISF